MSKTISREITIHVYKFAHVDAASMQMTDLVDVQSPVALGIRQQAAKSKELDGRLCVGQETKSVKYELPIDRFIAACEEYAKEVQEKAVKGESQSDENQTDENGYNQ